MRLQRELSNKMKKLKKNKENIAMLKLKVLVLVVSVRYLFLLRKVKKHRDLL